MSDVALGLQYVFFVFDYLLFQLFPVAEFGSHCFSSWSLHAFNFYIFTANKSILMSMKMLQS